MIILLYKHFNLLILAANPYSTSNELNSIAEKRLGWFV
jgi:hypothetical protein